MRTIMTFITGIAVLATIACAAATSALTDSEPATITKATRTTVTKTLKTTIHKTVTLEAEPTLPTRDEASLITCKEWDDTNRDGLLGFLNALYDGDDVAPVDLELFQMFVDYVPTNPSLAAPDVADSIRLVNSAVKKANSTLPDDWDDELQDMVATAFLEARWACESVGYVWG